MTRQIGELPPELAAFLVQAGPRRLVLLEGEDDLEAFEEWYAERSDDLCFCIAKGGCAGVAKLVQQAQDANIAKRIYGIIDRDFREDDVAEDHKSDMANHLFVLRRYCLENYLLEPDTIREELRVFYKGTGSVVPDADAIRADLLQMCRELGVAMAANWTLLEGSGIYLPEGFEGIRAVVVQYTAAKLGIDAAEAEQRIVAKESLLAPKLTRLEDAHTCISGKYLMFKVYDKYIKPAKRSLVKDYLFSLLVRTVKVQGVHADIKTIVEDRILR